MFKQIFITIILTLLILNRNVKGQVIVTQDLSWLYLYANLNSPLPAGGISCTLDEVEANSVTPYNSTTLQITPATTKIISISQLVCSTETTVLLTVNNIQLAPVIQQTDPLIEIPVNSQIITIHGFFLRQTATFYMGSISQTVSLSSSGTSYLYTTNNGPVFPRTMRIGDGSVPLETSNIHQFMYANAYFNTVIDKYEGYTVAMQMFNTGYDINLITLKLNGNKLTITSLTQIADTNQYKLVVDFPRGFGGGKIDLTTTFSMSGGYNVNVKPEITEATVAPSVKSGGKVTLSGLYFGNTTISVQLDDANAQSKNITCTPIGTFGESLSCQVPPGTGYFNLRTNSNNPPAVQSDFYEFYYQSPIITGVSLFKPVIIEPTPTPNNSSTGILSNSGNIQEYYSILTIKGQNFANKGLIVVVNDFTCDPIGVVDDSIIYCNVTYTNATQPTTLLDFSVTVDDLSGYKTNVPIQWNCDLGENNKECSNHGTCNRNTAECECKSGYSGLTCETQSSVEESKDDVSSSSIIYSQTLVLFIIILLAISF